MSHPPPSHSYPTTRFKGITATPGMQLGTTVVRSGGRKPGERMSAAVAATTAAGETADVDIDGEPDIGMDAVAADADAPRVSPSPAPPEPDAADMETAEAGVDAGVSSAARFGGGSGGPLSGAAAASAALAASSRPCCAWMLLRAVKGGGDDDAGSACEEEGLHCLAVPVHIDASLPDFMVPGSLYDCSYLEGGRRWKVGSGQRV